MKKKCKCLNILSRKLVNNSDLKESFIIEKQLQKDY